MEEEFWFFHEEHGQWSEAFGDPDLADLRETRLPGYPQIHIITESL